MTELPLPTNNPLVSIIIPSYNQGRFIRNTIDSILAQDYRPLEMVVVDGASTDETMEVLRSYGDIPELNWVSEPDSGVVEAVNKGFALAKGEIGAIQSSDDYYLPGAIQAGVNALTGDRTLGFVFGDIIKIDADGTELSRTTLGTYSLERVLSIEIWIPQPSTFFCLDLARQLGGWREEVPYAADTDLWFRMAFRAGARKLDTVMAARRLHDAQRDKQGARIIRDYCRMIDTLPGLPSAPKEIRRAAAAGKLLMRNRYDYDGGYWAGWWRLWRACTIYTPLRARIDSGALIPGWYPLLTLASRMKRVVTGTGSP